MRKYTLLLILLSLSACDDESNKKKDTCDLDCVNGTCAIVGTKKACVCKTGWSTDLSGKCTTCDTVNDYLSKNGRCVKDPCLACKDGANHMTCNVDRCECRTGYQDNDKDGRCKPTCATMYPHIQAPVTCDDSSGEAKLYGPRDCKTTFRLHAAEGKNFGVGGTFNEWKFENGKMTEISPNIFEYSIEIPPGEHGYKFKNLDSGPDDGYFVDPNNHEPYYEKGILNSRILVKDCNIPLLSSESKATYANGHVRFSVIARDGAEGSGIDPSSIVVTKNGESIAVQYDPTLGKIIVNDKVAENAKYAYRITVSTKTGKTSEELFVPVWSENKPLAWKDATMYFAMTDRFFNGNTANDATTANVEPVANWLGGDFKGIEDKIKEGYFQSMGVNAIWISPVNANPSRHSAGDDHHNYSGYHGYWPLTTGWTDATAADMAPYKAVDPHFGTLEELKSMIETAHKNGIRILIDFAANHVHIDSPMWKKYKNDGWFNVSDNANPDALGEICNGNGGSNWDRIPETCWFSPDTPDINYRNYKAYRYVMDHAEWLVKETNIDGFRLDAVKHMPIEFSYGIRERMNKIFDGTGVHFYMVGETFTSDIELLKKYISPGMLDGQFDFPVYYIIKRVLLEQNGNMHELKDFTHNNPKNYTAETVMSPFLGNHDVERAISVAAGTIKGNPKDQAWNEKERPAENETNENAHKKLRMAWAYLMTLPGIPLIYYGDEIALPGAGDPDNRRMMRFGANLDQLENKTLETVRKLGKLRSEYAAMRGGELKTLFAEDYFWVYSLTAGNDVIIVALNRDNDKEIDIDTLSGGAKVKDLVNDLDVTGKVVVPSVGFGIYRHAKQ